jgi:hypothetical protein
MNDCPNAEFRDRLPDLLHERLDAFARAAVVSHLDGCALCREELELLRGLHGVMVRQTTVRIDVTRIVRALPAPSRKLVVTGRRWQTDWRVAAAITMLLAAGTSVGTYLNVGGRDGVSDSVSAQSPTLVTGSTTGVSALSVAELPPAASELYVGGGLNDLSDNELRTLLNDIETFDGLPATDPEVVSPVPLTAPEE